MIDIQLIRDDAQGVAEQIGRRGSLPDLGEVLELDTRRRQIIASSESKRAEMNEASKAIGMKKKAGEDASAEMAATAEIKKAIAAASEELSVIEKDLRDRLLVIPNIPSSDIPTGTSEDDNLELKKWGEIPELSFEPQAHDDLGKDLGIMCAETGVKLAKTRFTLLRGAAARLERALINFMLDMHAKKGYEEILPPLMANSNTLTGTGQLPKFAEDLFHIEGEDLYLIPTAEVPLTNMVASQVLKNLEPGKPMKFMAYTPCFRSEAGSYGKDTKGYLRQHQFNKVELVKITHPDDSAAEHLSLTEDAESILQALKLPYRLVDLCTGDIGFSAQRTYDIEVWLPSQNTYREISSCSNFGDYQARRAGIRFKDKATKKNHIAHTINGSGLAVGRTLVAIFENYQQADGDIIVPEVLRPYMGGQTSLKI
ncbi:MAG: serine--tRNA ligase [Planctomycetes bacterium]|nr:serine--tRNA ligase [Planctomycetota bacterium]